MSPLVIVADGM